MKMLTFLQKWADEGLIPQYTSHNKQVVGVNRALCAPCQPDFLFDMQTHIVVIENDEHQHTSEQPRCSHIRLQNISDAFGQLPVYVIRYNPHELQVNGVTRRTGLSERMELLLKTLQSVFAKPNFDNAIILHFLFFNCTRCKEAEQCSFSHIDTFKTMFDYASYIELAHPYDRVGADDQKLGPSLMAQH